MKLNEVFIYTLLTITLTAVSGRSENPEHELSDTKIQKHMMKREASVLIENFPMGASFTKKPKIFVRRISRPRFRKSKPKFRSQKYSKPPSFSRTPTEKHHDNTHAPPRYSARSKVPKPYRYRDGKSSKYKPRFNFQKHNLPHFHHYPEIGFAEPPTSFPVNNFPQKSSYGEPPVDSYGAPIKPADVDEAPQQLPSLANHFEKEQNEFGLEDEPWKSANYYQDSSFAYSKKQPAYLNADPEGLTPLPTDYEQDDKHGVPYVYQRNQYIETKPFWLKNKKKKKVQYYEPSPKLLNVPWKSKKITEDIGVDEIIVGGRYAEPPARYVQKFQNNAIFSGVGELLTANGYLDTEVESATMSPYVNYKNSNMAFSPQNLNDAFSIVDK